MKSKPVSKSLPLSNFYGFDKSIKIPDPTLRPSWSQDILSYDPKGKRITTYIPEECLEFFDNESLGSSAYAVISSVYAPPADGFSTDDLVKYIREHSKALSKLDRWPGMTFNYRTLKALNIHPKDLVDENSRKAAGISSIWAQKVNTFFKLSSRRNDSALRIIEMNEFLHRAEENQTLLEFLESDKILPENCKSLKLIGYSSLTEDLLTATLPSFLKFDSTLKQDSKSLLASLTKEELIKIYSSNKVSDLAYRPGRKSTASYDYAKFCIDEILEVNEKIKVYTPQEAANIIFLKIMKDSESFVKLSIDKNCNAFSFGQELASSLSWWGDNRLAADTSFIRVMSLMIDGRIFDNLSAPEIIAITLGLKDYSRWSRATPGADTTTVLLNKIVNQEITLEGAARMILGIIKDHNSPLVIVSENRSLAIFNDLETPIDWLITHVDSAPKTASYSLPSIIRQFYYS